MPVKNRQFILAARPQGLPKKSDFKLVETEIRNPGGGEVLLRTLYLSVDPYMRGRISGVKTYADPVEIGAVMVGAMRITSVYCWTAIVAFGAVSICQADTIIYANSAGNSGVQVYDANTGVVTSTITTSEMASNNGRGVVVVGNIMYYTAASSASVFAYNLQTNTDLGVVFTVSGASGLATMAYDGTNLYLGDYSGTNNVYKYSLGGTLLQTIPLSKCAGFCDGLEYANGNLVSNERDGAFGPPSSYDVYSLGGTLMQSGLITAAFGATGIAWDGHDYWVSDIFGGKFDEYDASGNFVQGVALQNPTHLIEDLSANYQIVLHPPATPEPGSLLLLGSGLLGLGLAARRRRSSKR